jgi:hypothetical protein
VDANPHESALFGQILIRNIPFRNRSGSVSNFFLKLLTNTTSSDTKIWRQHPHQ